MRSPQHPALQHLRPPLVPHLAGGAADVLKAGGAAGAIVTVISQGSEKRVLKDFGGASWPWRCTLGRFLTRREWQTLHRLRGLKGVPAEPVRTGPCSLSYQFMDGETLSSLRAHEVVLEADFFCALEQLVAEVHARGFVHLDLRNGKNILRTKAGLPHLLDFQSGLWTGWFPARVRGWLQAVDRSGVYKWWSRLSPHTLEGRQAALLRQVNRHRRYWPFNYPRNDARLRE